LWLVWLGCLGATLYGHAHFFQAASQRAGVQRSEQIQPTEHTRRLEAELAALQTRPAATVAADLAKAQARSNQARLELTRCQAAQQRGQGACDGLQARLASLQAGQQALQVEMNQAERADALRQELAAQGAQLDQARAQAQRDPIDLALSSWLGWSGASLGLGVAMGQSLVLELLAASLWVIGMRGPKAPVTPQHPDAAMPLQPPHVAAKAQPEASLAAQSEVEVLTPAAPAFEPTPSPATAAGPQAEALGAAELAPTGTTMPVEAETAPRSATPAIAAAAPAPALAESPGLDDPWWRGIGGNRRPSDAPSVSTPVVNAAPIPEESPIPPAQAAALTEPVSGTGVVAGPLDAIERRRRRRAIQATWPAGVPWISGNGKPRN
jgi:hypothetical protein